MCLLDDKMGKIINEFGFLATVSFSSISWGLKGTKYSLLFFIYYTELRWLKTLLSYFELL